MFLLLTKRDNQKARYRVNCDNIKQYYQNNDGTTIEFLDGSVSLTVAELPEVLDKALNTNEIRKSVPTP